MVPSAAVGKAVADGFYVFADGFGHSAKDLFPVVSNHGYATTKLSASNSTRHHQLMRLTHQLIKLATPNP
jgi:hypothetical protein